MNEFIEIIDHQLSIEIIVRMERKREILEKDTSGCHLFIVCVHGLRQLQEKKNELNSDESEKTQREKKKTCIFSSWEVFKVAHRGMTT